MEAGVSKAVLPCANHEVNIAAKVQRAGGPGTVQD